jgi:hypothetical protein
MFEGFLSGEKDEFAKIPVYRITPSVRILSLRQPQAAHEKKRGNYQIFQMAACEIRTGRAHFQKTTKTLILLIGNRL